MPLTKREVEAIQPDQILWDSGRGSVSGFGVRRQRVSSVFIVKYTIAGRARWFSIGRFGSPWTVEAARAEARRLLGQVASGEDPAELKRSAARRSKVETVGQLCDRYLEAAQAGLILTRFNRPKKASTLQIDCGRVERHIKPLVGQLPVTQLDSAAVRRLVQDITLGKTKADVKTGTRGRAIVSGGPGTASRVADLLSGIMSWAVEEGLVSLNPVHGVRRYRGEPRDRHLSHAELRRLGAVLCAGQNETGSRLAPAAVQIITLLCLTGCRLSEIANLRWSEVDLEDSCLRLEDSKTGKSMRALGSAALQILNVQNRQVNSPFVFPASRGGGAYQGTKREAVRIFRAAGIENASCHTLRHTFGSLASELGYSDATIGGLLGHRGRGVTSRYVHRPDQALAAAAEVVTTEIQALLTADK